MTRGTLTKLETQVQGGTALKQLPSNGRQSRKDEITVHAYDMGEDCVEGVRLARATGGVETEHCGVGETVEGTGHCVQERLLVVVVVVSIGIHKSALLRCTLGSKAEISLASKVSSLGSGWLHTGL